MNKMVLAMWMALSLVIGILDSTFQLASFEEASLYRMETPAAANVSSCPELLEDQTPTLYCRVIKGWEKVWTSSNFFLGGINFLRFIFTDFLPAFGHVALWNFSIFDYAFLPIVQAIFAMITAVMFLWVVRDAILSRG